MVYVNLIHLWTQRKPINVNLFRYPVWWLLNVIRNSFFNVWLLALDFRNWRLMDWHDHSRNLEIICWSLSLQLTTKMQIGVLLIHFVHYVVFFEVTALVKWVRGRCGFNLFVVIFLLIKVRYFMIKGHLILFIIDHERAKIKIEI